MMGGGLPLASRNDANAATTPRMTPVRPAAHRSPFNEDLLIAMNHETRRHFLQTTSDYSTSPRRDRAVGGG